MKRSAATLVLVVLVFLLSTMAAVAIAPPSGGEGCTPGYWKNHVDSWVTYLPGDNFRTVFGVGFDKDLLSVLRQGGGHEKALGRHAVAALLNAAHPDVNYLYSVSQVKQMVQDAYASGNYEHYKDRLELENESVCPLGEPSEPDLPD